VSIDASRLQAIGLTWLARCLFVGYFGASGFMLESILGRSHALRAERNVLSAWALGVDYS
jgi:hypothetical protein